LHNWRVSLDSGKVRQPESEACVRTFDTKVVEGIVMVLLPAEQQEAAA
jgi:nitrite reductase/ring-hydroxylating ferredoxin subunit